MRVLTVRVSPISGDVNRPWNAAASYYARSRSDKRPQRAGPAKPVINATLIPPRLLTNFSCFAYALAFWRTRTPKADPRRRVAFPVIGRVECRPQPGLQRPVRSCLQLGNAGALCDGLNPFLLKATPPSFSLLILNRRDRPLLTDPVYIDLPLHSKLGHCSALTYRTRFHELVQQHFRLARKAVGTRREGL